MTNVEELSAASLELNVSVSAFTSHGCAGVATILQEQLSALKHLELYGCPVSKQLLENDSALVRRLRARGVRVLLQQSNMPVEMLKQLQQMQQDHQEQQRLPVVEGPMPTIVVSSDLK